jgi:hypothetical protein
MFPTKGVKTVMKNRIFSNWQMISLKNKTFQIKDTKNKLTLKDRFHKNITLGTLYPVILNQQVTCTCLI